MNVVLFDINIESYYPLTYTRPISYLRVGILTIKEKWEHYYNNVSVDTVDYLNKKYLLVKKKDNLWINSSIIPNNELVRELKSLRSGELLVKESKIIAFRHSINNYKKLNAIETNLKVKSINRNSDLFQQNEEEIKSDFLLLTKNKESASLDNSNTLIGNNIFIEAGAKIKSSILNSEYGPIYIGKDAEIMEGCMVRGPFAMLDNSILKMGAKIYGATTLGPFSYVGGELNNVVFLGYSNKSHDGFLGNAVIGEWCNFGAGSNNSNLKNNYTEVKVWDYNNDRFESTGLQFYGLIMGDHSKCGINTMFNTGTIIGVNTNIFGAGFVRNFLPSFSWGGRLGLITYKINKAFDVIDKVMLRRNIKFTDLDKYILTEVFNMTKRYRNFD